MAPLDEFLTEIQKHREDELDRKAVHSKALNYF